MAPVCVGGGKQSEQVRSRPTDLTLTVVTGGKSNHGAAFNYCLYHSSVKSFLLASHPAHPAVLCGVPGRAEGRVGVVDVPADQYCTYDGALPSKEIITEVLFLCCGFLTSQQHASISQGRICSGYFTYCHASDRSCRPYFLHYPVTVYRHRADQSQRLPYHARRLTGQPQECQCLSHRYDSTRKNPVASGIPAPDLPFPRRAP